MRGKAGKAPKPVEDQIVGFNRQLGFALTFVESVLRQGNRRAAIEVLEEQRVAIARTSASVQRSLVGSSQHRRRVRAIGPFAIAAALVVASALGALAAVRRTPAPAQRASVTKVSPAVGAPAGPGSNDERITGPASQPATRTHPKTPRRSRKEPGCSSTRRCPWPSSYPASPRRST